MLKSKVVTGQQIVADVRPKESVQFSGQTISSGGFVIVKIFERNSFSFISPSQDFFSSSLSVVTFSELKKGEFLKLLRLILVSGIMIHKIFFLPSRFRIDLLYSNYPQL